MVIDGEPVETTPEHPFYTVEAGWLDAEDLTLRLHVPSADGTNGVVEAISWRFQRAGRRLETSARPSRIGSSPRLGLFDLSAPEARRIILEVADAVGTWRDVASSAGITRSEQDQVSVAIAALEGVSAI